jgi:hypothetical protein
VPLSSAPPTGISFPFGVMQICIDEVAKISEMHEGKVGCISCGKKR